MTLTARGVPFPDTGDNNSTTTWLNSLAAWVNDNPGIRTLTTASRNALVGVDLWLGRQIFNTTTRQFEWYTGLAGAEAWQPVGHIRGEIVFLAYKPASIIPGFLPCIGGVIANATYADLVALIGTKFNTGGEGAGNTRLPNLQQRAIVGYDDVDLAYETGDIFGADAPAVPLLQHSHPMPHSHDIGHGHGSTGGRNVGHTHSMQGHTHGGSTSGEADHTHEPPPGATANAFLIRLPNYSGAVLGLVDGGAGTNVAVTYGDTDGNGGHTHSIFSGGPTPGDTGGESTDHSHGVTAFAGSSGGVSTPNTSNAGTAAPTLDVRQKSMALYPMIKY